MAGLTMNYNFTFTPRMKPRRSFDSIVLSSQSKREKFPAWGDEKRVETRDAERYLRREDARNAAFGNLMRADRNDKNLEDHRVPKLLRTPAKWRTEKPKNKPAPQPPYYMSIKSLDPVTAQRLIDEGARKRGTDKPNIFVLIGTDGKIIGRVAFPTGRSKNRHVHM